MFKEAPRLLVSLLALVVFSRLVIGIVTGASPIPAVIWPALLAALSLSALFGKRSAAKVLGFILFALGAVSLLMLVFGPGISLAGMIFTAGWGAAAIGTASYIFRSKAVKAFYSRGMGGGSPREA